MERDLEALLPLPEAPYDACEKQAGRVSSLSLVRYRTNDYSAPVAYGHRDVIVRGYVDRVVISCGSEVIARHPAFLPARRLRLRPHPLPAAAGAEDGGPGPGRSAGRVGAARGVPTATPSLRPSVPKNRSVRDRRPGWNSTTSISRAWISPPAAGISDWNSRCQGGRRCISDGSPCTSMYGALFAV